MLLLWPDGPSNDGALKYEHSFGPLERHAHVCTSKITFAKLLRLFRFLWSQQRLPG